MGIWAAPSGVLALTIRSSQPAVISGRETTMARMPAAMMAGPMPQNRAIASIAMGARALPRKPEKVWIEKDRPSREGSMTDPRMA